MRPWSHSARSCSSTGVVEEREREEAPHLGLVRHEVREEPAEADGLSAQLVAHEPVAARGVVALVEDQVHDREHAAQAVGQDVVRGHAVRDVRLRDLALGARDALPHRGVGYEERARDLLRGEAAQHAEGQSHPRRQGESRVAAGEDQPQAVVVYGAFLGH